MINFFARKNYLVDSLSNFVDIHNHILPGIDDGAKTVDDSLALLKGFDEIGIRKFIATPHIMHNFYDNDRESINDSLERLKSALLEHKMKDFAIEASAEHMIDDNFESLLDDGGEMPLRKDYILVEMSYLQPSINFDEAIIKIAQKGYYPILAHPERYIYLKGRMRRLSEYKSRGIQFQLNLLSLGEYYGSDTYSNALKILDAGLFDFVGTDIHNLNQLNALKEMKLSKRVHKKVLPLIYNTIEDFY